VELEMPDGAFYLFPDFSPLAARLAGRGIRDSGTLCERLLEETGVATLPGEAFGRPAEELTLRLAFVDFDGEQALAAAAREARDRPLDDAFLRRHCGRCVTAVEKMAAWVVGEATPQ